MADEDTNTNPRDLRAAPSTHNPDSEDCCVICLEDISDPCELAPCGHYNFDVGCIGTWLAVSRRCPLCKVIVNQIIRGPRGLPGRPVNDIRSPSEFLVAELWPGPSSHTPATRRPRYTPADFAAAGAAYARSMRRAANTAPRDVVLRSIAHRRAVYARGLLSIHVDSGPISGYRELTPALFHREPQLIARARAFLQRELRVFDSVPAERAAFLIEHVVDVLQNRDIGTGIGLLEALLTANLGRSSARLLLHELGAWLRSPYTSLEEWDAAVRYPRLGQQGTARVEEQRQDRLREQEEMERRQRVRDRIEGEYKFAVWLPSRAYMSRIYVAPWQIWRAYRIRGVLCRFGPTLMPSPSSSYYMHPYPAYRQQ
ncbi:putative RING finger protein C16G5.03 [Beauveria bassiana]|uniref:RING-type E3 ubiquitin transferase n=1 Tax=Beauveria bassiana TaxID=176275 RepID=A0A2N6NKR8_BEABA|nr:putative RING finger protein C16G5.03 [Beauveria bassiana]